MKAGLIIVAGISFLAAGSAPAHADTQFDRCEAQLLRKSHIDSELGSCGAAWVARTEQRLAVAWRKALAGAGGSQTEQGHALLDEQRAWIGFKEHACLSYEVQSAGTLSRFHDANICIAEIIEDRVRELSGDLDGKGLS